MSTPSSRLHATRLVNGGCLLIVGIVVFGLFAAIPWLLPVVLAAVFAYVLGTLVTPTRDEH